MRELKKFLRNPFVRSVGGTVVGVLAAGALLANRNRLAGIPVVGDFVDDASQGFDGQSARKKFLGIF